MAIEPVTDIGAPPAELATDPEAALGHHRAGRLEEAEGLYRGLLDAAPEHPRALHLLGVVETQRGRPERGVELIRGAFPALAGTPEPLFDLGTALRLAGKREEAPRATGERSR
jgi:Flp pilus assembly protein TadD